MTAIVVTFVAGFYLGVCTMCIFNINKDEDEYIYPQNNGGKNNE